MGLARLVLASHLTRVFWRPAVAGIFLGSRYRKKKKLLYTVMTGGYDNLNELPRRLAGWHCICFTDNQKLTSTSWEIRHLRNDQGLDTVRFARYWKIHNHLVDDGYDLSVYIDANIRVRGNLDNFIAHALPTGRNFATLEHPFLSSLSEELEQCLETNKDDARLLTEQYRYYVDEKKFTDPYPQINSRLLIRRAKDPHIRALMEGWFAQLTRWSRRDQMAFNYALSQHPAVQPHYIPYWVFRRYFQRLDHR